MNPFSGIREAKTFGKGQWMEPGKYLVDIVEVKLYSSDNPQKPGMKYIVEFTIAESDNDDIKVGGTRSYVIPMNSVMSMSNVKGFIAECLGASADDASQDWEGAAEASCGADQPFAGMQMKLTCWHIDTKAGGTYTVHKWEQSN